MYDNNYNRVNDYQYGINEDRPVQEKHASLQDMIQRLSHYHNPDLKQNVVFQLRKEDLELFFKRDFMEKPHNEGEWRITNRILERVGWVPGLLERLATSETGIIGDDKDLKRRTKFFGKNKRSKLQLRKFSELLWEQFQDEWVVVLLVLAAVSLVSSFWSDVENAWVESVAILLVVAINGSIQSICENTKEKQYKALRKEIQNETCEVIRGYQGVASTIPVSQIVVGDIVVLRAGDRVPADCLLIEEMDMRIDESIYYPNQKDPVEKQVAIPTNQDTNPDTVLLYRSQIQSGYAKAVVLAVGKNTLFEKEDRDDGMTANLTKETGLQKVMQNVADLLSKKAYKLALLIVVVLNVYLAFRIMISKELNLISSESFQMILSNFMIGAAFLIAALPEGLPLSVSIATAFSFDRLKKENLLIKTADALENAGSITDIITGKTSTLTEGVLEVRHLWLAGQKNFENVHRTLCMAQNELADCLFLSADVSLEIDDEKSEYFVKGGPIETCLINYLDECTGSYGPHRQILNRQKKDSDFKFDTSIPFCPERKSMLVSYCCEKRDRSKRYRVVLKGAPEEVITHCSSQLEQSCNELPLSENDKIRLTEDVVEAFARGYKPDSDQDAPEEGTKPIMIAFKDYDEQAYNELKSNNDNFETEESREVLWNDMTLLAVFGLRDELRPGVIETLASLSQSRTQTRICSGDHEMTVRSLANELQMNVSAQSNYEILVESGEQFRKQIGDSMVKHLDPKTKQMTWGFKDEESAIRFGSYIDRIQMIYRASPEDKHKLVAGLKQRRMGGGQAKKIAMTGDSISDAPALRAADVGLCMQDGCDVAKDCADFVILNNDYKSVFNAARWGRNIFDSIRKFLQFQVTVAISLTLMLIISSVTLGRCPFTVMQILWINLVMDVLAACALATESPHPTELPELQKDSENEEMIKPVMRRSIWFQAIYQNLVIVTLLYFGPMFYGIEYNIVNDHLGNTTDTQKDQHYTMIFQTFCLMNIVNMLNCRVIPTPVDKHFNVFVRIHHNWLFPIIMLIELNFQFAITYHNWLRIFFGCTPLTFWMSFASGCLALGSLVVEALAKLTSDQFCEKLPAIVELKEDKMSQISSFSQIMLNHDDDVAEKPASYFSSGLSNNEPAYNPYAQREVELAVFNGGNSQAQEVSQSFKAIVSRLAHNQVSEIKLEEECDQIVYETMSYYDQNNTGVIDGDMLIKLMENYRYYLIQHLQERAQEAPYGDNQVRMDDGSMQSFLNKAMLNANPANTADVGKKEMSRFFLQLLKPIQFAQSGQDGDHYPVYTASTY